ncbi:MAG: SpoIID/LytB domain-containing protein [Thermodesulfobacteriota bacterium]
MKRPDAKRRNRAPACGFLVLLLAAAVYLIPSSPAISQPQDPRFSQASAFLAQGRFAEAFSAYEEIYQNPRDRGERARALFYMAGVSSSHLSNPEEAVRLYDALLRDFPASPLREKARYQKAMAFFADKRYKEARAALLRFAERRPESALASSARIFAEEAGRRLEEAPPDTGLPEVGRTIRVRILSGEPGIMAASPQGLQARDPAGRSVADGESLSLACAGEDVAVNGGPPCLAPLLLSSPSGAVTLNGKAYRGEVLVSCDATGLQAVNRLDVESYLYGVLPREMPASWPREALKAQAVAARTFALYAAARRKDADFDLSADTGSQVYGSMDAERPESNRAVDETRGQTLLFGGDLAMAYFHSDSAGHTEDAAKVWGTGIPYLSGVPDPFTADLPSGTFSQRLSFDEIQSALGGESPGRVTGLSAGPVSESGRMESVIVTGTRGSVPVNANRFRLLVGPAKIRSTRFTIESADGGVVLSGAGYGHGVGMSQYGARAMAKSGSGYRDILVFYYRGASVGGLF